MTGPRRERREWKGRSIAGWTSLAVMALAASLLQAQAPPAPVAGTTARLDGYKQETAGRVDEMAKLAQEMVDSVFSFSELGFQEVETSRYLTAMLEKNGFSIRRGVAGVPTAWVATFGSRQAGDRAGLGHRRHPAGVAETGRVGPLAADRRRTGARRGPQHRRADEHHRGPGGEAHHGARQAAGDAGAVAGRRRGAARVEGVVRARGRVQGRGRLPVRPRRRQPGCGLGRHRGDRPRLGASTRSPARPRTAPARPMARPQRARRGGADERGVELQARAPAHPAALALRDHRRRRPAERRAGAGHGLVLLPRDRLPAHQGDVGLRQQDGRGRRR